MYACSTKVICKRLPFTHPHYEQTDLEMRMQEHRAKGI